MATDVVVVGAGLAGLSAAAHLAVSGMSVTVVEASGAPGGRVSTEVINGHRYDTGATVLTMSSLIVDALSALGIEPSLAAKRLDLIAVDPTYHMRYADGTELDVARDLDAFADEINKVFGPGQRDGFARLRPWLAELYEVEFSDFIDRNVESLLDYLRPELRTGLTRLVRMGAAGPLSRAVGKFITDERLLRAFTFQALYAGVPPSRAPGVYAVIGHMDIGLGLAYPRGGMGQIGRVLAEALIDAGVPVRMHTRAESVDVRGGSVRGVRLTGGERIDCAAVVLTTDLPVTDKLLAEAGVRRRRTPRQSPSAVVVHGTVPAEVSAGWPGHHHTIDFGQSWETTFSEITRRPTYLRPSHAGQLMSDPSMLITRPGRTDPDHFITDGRESVSILAPCPNLESASLAWDYLAPNYVAEFLAILQARGYHGISDLAIDRIDHPLTWHRAGMAAGTPFAAAHTYTQTGPLRTPNVWPGIDTAVLAGSATVPGVGIPPVLVSGRLAAARVVQALSQRQT